MKRVLTILMLGITITINAQNAREEIKSNPWLAGSNYLDYDRQLPDFKYTKAPKGYVPFYFTHYGRHGSRWLIGKDDYERVLRPLRKANEQGKLTSEGKKTLELLEKFNKTTNKRLGDLTTVGERQHHGIGKRIAKHFPEIFLTKNLAIDARSTVVTRCVLSMVAECEELMAANPTARIHNDVSESLQYYLNQGHEGKVREASRHIDRDKMNAFSDSKTHPERLMKVLFNDAKWAADSVRQNTLMRNLYEVVINMQSHDDTCVALGKPQATMRFGHEVCVLPLACLMELGNSNASIEDLNELDKKWQNYKIFPMGCNIQLIFYKPKNGKGDILVKALLNEREVTLPVTATSTPYYYKWSDLRQYWTKKLDSFNN